MSVCVNIFEHVLKVPHNRKNSHLINAATFLVFTVNISYKQHFSIRKSTNA